MPSFLQGRFLKKEASEHARADDDALRGNGPAAMAHEARALKYGSKADTISHKREAKAAAWFQKASYEHTLAATAAAQGDSAGVNKHGWRAHQATKEGNRIMGRNHVHAPYARPGVVPGMPGPPRVGPAYGPTVVTAGRGPPRYVGEAMSKGAMHSAGYGASMPMVSTPMPGPSAAPMTYRSGEVGSSGTTAIPANATVLEPVYANDYADSYADSYVESQSDALSTQSTYYEPQGSVVESYVTDQGYTDPTYYPEEAVEAVATEPYYDENGGADGQYYEASAGGTHTSAPQPHVDEYIYDEYQIDEFGNPIDEYHYKTVEEHYY